MVICGNFNHSDIDWIDNNGICRNKGRLSSIDMIDCLNDNTLSQLVIKPTFLGNTLDLVITDDPSRVYHINHGAPIGYTAKNHLLCTLNWDFYFRDASCVKACRH